MLRLVFQRTSFFCESDVRKKVLSDQELKDHLQEQIQFIERSCKEFDNGHFAEAKRLAVAMRVLLHDTKNSKSLLGQLGRNDIQFLDTAIPATPGSLTAHGGLVFVAAGPSNTHYVAMLDDVPQTTWLGFSDWWRGSVFIDSRGRRLSRRDLAITAANQDGGAHVDPELEEVYYELSKENSLSWFSFEEDKTVPLGGPERAALRQIAHETLKSLNPNYCKKPTHEADLIIGGSMRVATISPEEFNRNPLNSRFARRKLRRNEPCPCGSGEKYKHCHGRLRPQ